MSETDAATKAEEKRELKLPTASYPVVNRVLSDNPFPPTVVTPGIVPPVQPVLWLLGEAHPMMPDMKVMRMYVVMGVAVEVYSAAANGTMGCRHTIPWPFVRLCEEVMDPETFVEEITEAERDSGDEPETPTPTALSKTNGAAVPTA
jgi:hypothetical protein